MFHWTRKPDSRDSFLFKDILYLISNEYLVKYPIQSDKLAVFGFGFQTESKRRLLRNADSTCRTAMFQVVSHLEVIGLWLRITGLASYQVIPSHGADYPPEKYQKPSRRTPQLSSRGNLQKPQALANQI